MFLLFFVFLVSWFCNCCSKRGCCHIFHARSEQYRLTTTQTAHELERQQLELKQHMSRYTPENSKGMSKKENGAKRK